MPSRKIDQELVSAAQAGDAAKVSSLLAYGANPRSKKSGALVAAGENGHVECVRLLLPVSDAKAAESLALRVAANYGHAECVRMLLPLSDAKAENFYALRSAACSGHVECVRMLLAASDAKAMNSYALQLAAANGHAECVRLLLPVSDPAARNSLALRWAAESGRVECLWELLAESKPLVEIDGLLAGVMAAGQAKVAAILIEQEPRLLDGMDISKCLALAMENKHEDLAAYLSSIIDRKELLGMEQDRPASSRGLARL